MSADEQNVLITFESPIGGNKEDIISFFVLFDYKYFSLIWSNLILFGGGEQ